MVDAFEKKIISTVEETVSNKILEKMKKLDAKLQSLPKEGKIDDDVAVNLTFTGSPVLDDSSVEVGINGLFMANGDGGKKVSGSISSFSTPRVKRMVGISIEEEVFNSATLVYFIVSSKSFPLDEFGGTISFFFFLNPGKEDACGYPGNEERVGSKHI